MNPQPKPQKNETHEVRTKASQWSRPSAWIPHKNNGVDLGLKELIFSVMVNLHFHCGGWLSSLSPKSERERERTERWEINCCRRMGERKERGRAGKYGIYGGWLRFDFSGCMFFMFMNYERPIPHFNFVFFVLVFLFLEGERHKMEVKRLIYPSFLIEVGNRD